MKLSNQYIADIREILENISAKMPGYKPRDPQKRMIAAVARTLARAAEVKDGEDMPPNDGSSIVCIQGPTGIGKSLGYLIGASVAARAKGKKIVISSATVALQEQLVGRDVPFFIEHSGVRQTFAIAKGRGRYVCHAKLLRSSGEACQDDLFGNDEAPERAEVTDAKLYAELLTSYESGQWSGDRDELPAVMNDASWSRITNDRHGCINKKCPQFTTCAQMKARSKIREADIVIANHDLLLTDMALGGGVILPALSDTFYILDEGHHLAQKGVDAFAKEHQVDDSRFIMEKLSGASAKFAQAFPAMSTPALKAEHDADELAEYLDAAYHMFGSIDKAVFLNKMWRFPENKLPQEAETLASNIIITAISLSGYLDTILEFLKDNDSVVSGKFMSDLGFFKGKVDNVLDVWRMIQKAPADDAAPIAKWVTLHERREKVDFVLHASPVYSGDMLVRHFFKQASGVVLTSATLTSLGTFDRLLSETGLSSLPNVSLLELPSPFNHAEQGVLKIPDLKASAKDPVAHTAAIIKELPDLIDRTTQNGTLVLFASRKQMRDVFDGLPAWLRQYTLVQGDSSKESIISAHMARINAGKPSVIFGLQSFSEGLDLPGAACEHVVITKLPFAVPSDPVQETMSEWLAKQGKSYFMEIAVPKACLRMIQSAGRLIRAETDKGTLTILDDRIKKQRYGRMILESLPPFRMA